MDALRLTDMAMEKRNARDMFRPGIDIIQDTIVSLRSYLRCIFNWDRESQYRIYPWSDFIMDYLTVSMRKSLDEVK